ncbi:uncharacterized protein LOC112188531 isoform X4 [Rosa chinensis]|uniref:uncharacterized protein LOC112188531 isoform X4 n=1 Tax=Rosa chinensis TaxID=74649 RepID=UPI000D09039D|nr:uncharacterized protein LOC112188531 isoform X4 [Rosa chinensis]
MYKIILDIPLIDHKFYLQEEMKEFKLGTSFNIGERYINLLITNNQQIRVLSTQTMTSKASKIKEVEDLLSDVGQAPSTSLQDALLPTMTALISTELLRHSHMDVKVSVASCITEITRITAPEAPYNDEQMKEIFKLTVAAFENLAHLSSRSYKKAASILRVVAKVRSSVMMLDLDCYTLIAEMFQYFLNIIQSNHPHAVFSDMQTIMTMVLDEIHESEEIPLELLKILLSSVRKENQNVSPFSWKLGETVLDNCSAKVKPYLMEAVKSMGTAMDDYAHIVASICQNGSGALKLDHVNDSAKNLVTEVVTADAACPSAIDKSVPASARDEHIVLRDSSKTLQRCHLTKHSKEVDSQDGAQPNKTFSVKAVKSVTEPDSGTKKKAKRPSSSMDPEEKSEIEPYSAPKKRGRKPNSLMNPEEGYENYWMHSGKKSPKSAGNRKSHEKGSNSLPTEDHLRLKVTLSSTLPSTLKEVTQPSTLPSTHQKVTEPPNAQPKIEGEIGSASSFLQNGHPEGTESRRGRPKKQVAIAQQEANPTSLSAAKGDFLSAQAEEKSPRSMDTLNMESKETSSLKAKSRGRPRKFRAKTNDETIIASVHVGTEKESAVPCDQEEKQQESALTLGTGNINDQSAVQKVGTGNVSETKPRGRPRKLAAKINQETFLASAHVVVTEKESPVPCDPEQKRQQEPALQYDTGSIKDQSAIKGIKKRRRDDAPSKDSAEGSLSKKFSKCEAKLEGDKNVVEGTPKIVRKRKRSIGKEEANPMPDPDDRLVGKGIKVWWPQDKTYYDGVVRSYDTVKKKHLVLYNDGEKENLNLRKQRWQLIGDDSKDPCIQLGQKSDTPKTDASDIPQKRKRKAKSESSKQANAGFSLKRISRTGASAGLSTVECMKSDSKSADRSTVSEPIKDETRDDKSKEIDRLTDDEGEIYAGKLKADMKTGIDSTQITPEAMNLSKEESAKVDIEPSVRDGAKEMKELSNGAKDASSSPSPVLDKAV